MCVFYEFNMMSYNNAFILQGSSPPTFEIPTFTVTINPLESDEMTFVPGSPPAVSGENQPLLSGQNSSTSGNNQTGNGNSMMSNRSIANMTVIVDDEVTTTNNSTSAGYNQTGNNQTGNNQTGNSNKFSAGNGNSMMSNRCTAQLLLLNTDGQVHFECRKRDDM